LEGTAGAILIQKERKNNQHTCFQNKKNYTFCPCVNLRDNCSIGPSYLLKSPSIYLKIRTIGLFLLKIHRKSFVRVEQLRVPKEHPSICNGNGARSTAFTNLPAIPKNWGNGFLAVKW